MMMKQNLKWGLVVAALSAAPEVYSKKMLSHTVVPGNTLSEILYAYDLKPIYGSRGTLEETLLLNPEIRKGKNYLIVPGQIIFLPIEEKELASTVSQEVPVTTEREPSESSETPAVDSADKAKGIVTASLGVNFFNIKGSDRVTNASAIVLSGANPTLNLGFNLLWNDTTSISLSSNYMRFSLQPLNGNQKFSDERGHKVDLSLHVFKKLSEKWALGAGVSFDQDLFFHAESASLLRVDQVFITKPEIHARFESFKKSNASIGIDGVYGLNLANEVSAYKIDQGTHAGAGLFFNYHKQIQDDNYKALEAKVFYRVNEQNTSVTTRKVSDLSFIVTYAFGLPW